MITKTGIEYSENSDLSNSTTIEENGTVNSINIPSWELGVDLYCQAYVIEDGDRINSSIEHYLPTNWFYLKNEYAGQNTITFTKTNTPDNFQYSKDKMNWTTANSTRTVTMEEGERVYMRCTGNLSKTSGNWKIDCSEIYSIGGNLKSLDKYNYNPGEAGTYNISIHGCGNLFEDSTTLVDASEVDLSGFLYIAASGMSGIFSGCTNLAKAPNMGSIVTVGMYGLSSAFYSTAIETIDLHSVNYVADGAFGQAFENSSLRTISMDNITTCNHTGSRGYYLWAAFRNCQNLTRGIDLSNLRINQGDTFGYQMYYNCSNLEEATYPNYVPNTTDNLSQDWLYGAGTNVSGTKTVYCPTGKSVPTNSDSGVPSGWTRVDY